MDEKKFFSLFKSLQGAMRCPSCDSTYAVSEMQFVGSQDGYFLLSMNCSKCSLPVWVNVFAGNNPTRSIVNDLTIGDVRLAGRSPITTDEVINFSKYIRSFKGDLKKTLNPHKW
jgi:hypothetical protein